MPVESSPSVKAQHNDASFANVWQELKWRGLIQISTDEEELEKALSGEPLSYYCGFDPTAPSLHLGHLVQLLTMRRLQLAGHHPIGLVGGSTGLIGDPRPTSERTLNTKEVVAEWVGYLQGQVSRFLSFEGANGAQMVNNLDWTAPLTAIDFLRDIGKYFRVGTMIKKDAVSARLNSDAGISYTEFSYQLLQGLDFLELFRKYDCTLQTGGSDQWGNLTAGVDLIHRAEGRSAHAIGTPLITNSDGTKFGKSEGNAIWLDENLTSPYEFYQFWLNAADADVLERLRVFTFMSREEIDELGVAVAERPHLREAQRALAYDVCSLVHGTDATDKVIAASAALFGQGDLQDLDELTLKAATAELPQGAAARGAGIVDVLVASGLIPSKSAARRTIGEGGAYVNNVKITDPDSVMSDTDLLHGRYLLVRRGKRNLAIVEIDDGAADTR